MAFSSPLRPAQFTPRQRRHNSFIQRHGMSPPGLVDSSSRDLLVEFQKLWLDQNKLMQDDLDEQLAQQANRHNDAIALATAEHDRIRQNAEIEQERLRLEAERARELREARERDRLESERRAKAALEAEELRKQKDRVERQQQEEAAKAAQEREIHASKARIEEERQRVAAEAAALKQKQEDEQAKAKERAREAVVKAREEAEKAAQAASAPQSIQQTQQSPNPLQNEFENLHKRYLDLHKQLKQLREYVVSESKKNPALKTRLGDLRREIVQSTGQLTIDKSKNRAMMAKIQGALQEASKHDSPVVDAAPYLISVTQAPPGQQVPVPGPLLYLLNIFAKAIVKQFIDATGGSVGAADPVGVIAVSIFAAPSLKINQSVPLIDILLAKYHAQCPLLFCITPGTSTATAEGRARIGWVTDSLQRHLERMTGLGSGWAALSLRDFSKSKNDNPLPNFHYWRALAGMANTPSQDFGVSHAAVIRSLIEGFVPRFMGFYGAAARAALRAALVDLPARVHRDRPNDASVIPATASLELLREQLQRNLGLTLA